MRELDSSRRRADRAKRVWAAVIDEPPPALPPSQVALLGRHSAVSYDAEDNLILAPQSSRIRDETHRLGLYHRLGDHLRGRTLAAGIVLDDNCRPPPLRGPSVPILPDRKDQLKGESLGLGLVAPRQCDAVAFLHTVFAQLGLPRSKPMDENGAPALQFTRDAGRVSLLVTVGHARLEKERWVRQPLPYGSKPRLMLLDVCTEAVRGGSREVDLLPSVRQYLRNRLGLEWSAGAKGQYTLFRKQALALAACRMHLGVDYPSRSLTYKGDPIRRFEAWLDDGDQAALWPGRLVLDTEFFEALQEFGVPIDQRAYASLARSPLAMDAYAWLAHRMWRIDRSVDISWESLHRDFGQEYKRLRAFRARFTAALKAAQGVYPQAVDRIHSITDGVRLYYAQPPVSRADLKKLS